ncbi:Plexin-A1 [Mactra antiquata]
MEVFLKVTAYFGLVLIYQVAYVNAFQLPSSKVDIAKYSSIKATKTCSTGFDNVACNTTCPSRTHFPTMATPLKTVTSTCTGVSGDSTIPNNANITNGGVLFNNTTCSSVNKTYNVMKYFTISMWINVNCDNCNILEIANKIQVTSKTDGVYLNAYKLSIDKNTWTLVTIRYGTDLRWSVNNASYSTPLALPVLSNPLALMFGPNKNFSSTESLKIVDARFYHDALTMRERNSLYNGMFQLLPFHSECRCPSTHGELVQNTFPKQYMKCTNGSNQVSRFNTDSKMVEFLNDGDENTAWNSGETSDVTITIPLQKSFQLHQISLTGVTKDPIELKIIVYHGNQVRDTRIFREDCSAGSNTCLDYSEHVTSKVFKFTFDADISSTTTPTREQYKKTVADKIYIWVKTQDYFTVSEIKLLVRCDCGGNDAACTIKGTKYTCNCSPASNTKGVNCDQCVDSYYRKTTALTCDIPCKCNLTGSTGTSCEETSGNCTCKTNVSGRQCDTCMHNTANFSSTGCTACSCNSEGIQSCSTGLVCNCKNNVERDSGKCNKCVPNFYNLSHSDGCLPCDCFSSGTVDSSQNTCNETTGQCQCKSLVQGRQCNECVDESYDLSSSHAIRGCMPCRCSVVGSVDNICNKSTGLCTCKMERVAGLSLRDCAPTNLTLDPTYGPLSGGTKLTIKGHDLGEDVQLSFNIANEPQSITNRNNTHIFIETNPSSSKGKKSIKLYWVDDNYQDHVGVFTQQYTFEYREDPVIAAASRKPRKTYASGGCKMRLGGNDLNSVAYPKLLVYSSNIPIESPCTGEGNLLTCITPNLTQYGANNEVSYGLYFDNVIAYRNLSTIKILEDPSIDTGNDENYRNSFDDVFKITVRPTP